MARALRLTIPLVVVLALLPAASAAGASSRVVGGVPATVEKYPWQAGVVLAGSGGAQGRLFCGGSLVTPYIVLTAAHCVYDTDPDNLLAGIVNDRLDADDVDVVLGRTTLSSSAGAEHTVRAVDFQSSYDEVTVENDVGYLVLSSPSSLPTIAIAGADESALWVPGSPTEVSGWGATSEGGGVTDTLRSATVPIIADSTCASPSVYDGDFHPASMVCAGYLGGGVDSCSGDSGGPLQAPAQGGIYRLVGVTSFGAGCARANAPGIYSRVAGDGLRNAIAAKVSALESAHGLPHTTVLGSGARPLSESPASAPVNTKAKAKAKRKCRRIDKKRKRKRCLRRARRL